jgi:hypothetical protein
MNSFKRKREDDQLEGRVLRKREDEMIEEPHPEAPGSS